MKRVIRESVFETNSSSNHAVFIKRKKPDKEIPNYAVVKPYDKMLFMWGLISFAYDYRFFNDYSRMTEEEKRDIMEQNAEIEARCESYKKIMIEECLKYEKFDIEKTEKMMNESFYNNVDSDCFTCNDYFYEGVLDECTCFFDEVDIAKFMKIERYDGSEQKFRELVQKFFADNEVYLLPIGYLCDRPEAEDFD